MLKKLVLYASIGSALVFLIVSFFFRLLSFDNILSFQKVLLASIIIYLLLFVIFSPLNSLDKKLDPKLKLLLVFMLILVFFIISFTLKLYASIPSDINFTCSMYHEEKNFDRWWENNKFKYGNITKEEFEKFPFKNGLDKPNYYIEVKPKEIKIGDVVSYYSPFSNKNVGHRIINKLEANGSYFFEVLGDKNNYFEIINASYVNGRLIEIKLLSFFGQDKCKEQKDG